VWFFKPGLQSHIHYIGKDPDPDPAFPKSLGLGLDLDFEVPNATIKKKLKSSRMLASRL
jgi:hypothetical protein